MNVPQDLWLRQARSDWSMFATLRRHGAPECHLLHYLQMTTEKLSKAYLWRSGKAPPRTHTGFIRFLKTLLDRKAPELRSIAPMLGFRRSEDLERWVGNVQPLAYAIQNIAPAEARDGPNPEYPWPHASPAHAPVGHSFDLWSQLSNSGQGRKLIEFVKRAIENFESYGGYGPWN